MRTILIIDDDIAIGNMEQEVLERVGYTTRRAYSGTEALLIHLLLLRHSITEVARGLEDKLKRIPIRSSPFPRATGRCVRLPRA